MELLILPVSGGRFIYQITIMEMLSEINYEPNLIFSSSGGNVCSMIAAAADWKWNKMEIILRQLKKNMFSTYWNSFYPLSFIIGYFKGNLFNEGKGIDFIFNNYFNKERIKKYEIWTGTFNMTQNKPRVFCNKDKKDCLLDDSYIDYDLYQTLPPIYANGDLKLIEKYSIASAAIPGTIPPIMIEDEYYIDGGVSSASPLYIMKQSILKLIGDKPMHLIYIGAYNLNCTYNKDKKNLFNIFHDITSNIFKSQFILDRVSAFELLNSFPGKLNYIYLKFNFEVMKKIKEFKKEIKYSLLEVFPENIQSLNIFNFTDEELDNFIKTKKKYKCSFWWLGENNNIIKDINKYIIKK